MFKIEKNGYTVVFASEAVEKMLGKASCSVALGNFDGVHLAHKELILGAIQMKKSSKCDLAGAWTFSKNPLEYFIENPPKAICTPEKKAEILLSMGMDFVVLADFPAFCNIPHNDFCEYLKDEFGAVAVVCGYNYKFGKGGFGNSITLADVFGKENTLVIDKVDYDGAPISSTRIRGLIEGGNIELANVLLGRPFSLVAEVVGGKQLGRNIGFPTANQSFLEGSIIPKKGIYATKCIIAGETYIGVTNVGIRPTVESTKNINAETYILNFSGDIYGEKIEIEFIKYLREEQKFLSIDELKAQISLDASAAKETVKI